VGAGGRQSRKRQTSFRRIRGARNPCQNASHIPSPFLPRDRERRVSTGQAHTRLGGYALDQLNLSQLQETDHLIAGDGGIICEKLLQGRVAFDVIYQALNWHTGTFEARCTAHALGIDPDDFANLGRLFGSHTLKVHDQAAQRSGGLAARRIFGSPLGKNVMLSQLIRLRAGGLGALGGLFG
jgi:hypothetical protein